MRRLSIIVLLLIYSASQVGSILITYYKPIVRAISSYRQQRRMRQKGTTYLDTTMAIKQYQACLHDKGELMINGVLYDIKHLTINDGKARLQLLEDRKETNWMNTFGGFMNALHKQKRSQRTLLQVWNWLHNIYSFDKEINLGILQPVSLTIIPRSTDHLLNSRALTSPGQPPESWTC